MAMNPNPNLPEELLIEIFSRLPAKSVGKFRSLSKPWRAQLSAPKFIKSHLTRQTHQENIILISRPHALDTISTIDRNYKAVLKRVNLSNSWSEVVGSCNGLVLLVNKEDQMFLVNPTTLEQVRVPGSPIDFPKNVSFRTHGFGYDACSDDYKIVTLSYFAIADEWLVDPSVDVYSVKSGVWKRLDGSPYAHAIPFESGAYVDGVLHWLVRRKESGYPIAIAAFDLGREEFYDIPAPMDVKDTISYVNKLVALEGCLCMMDGSSGHPTDFWILKEYGKEKSWTKLRIDDYYYKQEIIKPLCFIGDDEVVLLCEGEYLLVYNFKVGCLSNRIVDAVHTESTDACTFIESLVSPFLGNQNEGHVLI